MSNNPLPNADKEVKDAKNETNFLLTSAHKHIISDFVTVHYNFCSINLKSYSTQNDSKVQEFTPALNQPVCSSSNIAKTCFFMHKTLYNNIIYEQET